MNGVPLSIAAFVFLVSFVPPGAIHELKTFFEI